MDQSHNKNKYMVLLEKKSEHIKYTNQIEMKLINKYVKNEQVNESRVFCTWVYILWTYHSNVIRKLQKL